MDSSANSLINPDARMGLATSGAATGAGGAASGAADDLGGGFAQRLGSLSSLRSVRGNPRAPLIVAVAVLVAVVAGLVLWSRAPDYKVLYSNLSDRDGGSIITALQAANVPYKLSDGGGAILVPSEQVNEMRLRLAQQGLPKNGSVGFELMDNQKFGISQFAEQVNYQRALEGELEQTIQSIQSVKSARVHLAIPKPSVFVREREAPSASVLVNLYPGRVLDEGQVAAVTHMISSAVPDLPVRNVTVVDQDGNLLTQSAASAGLDASQLKYVRQIEHDTQSRIDAILAPLFGSGNARSQVSADVDFSKLEQTSENYGPNANPQQASIRSQQQNIATDMQQSGAGGVPGALSNQPPQPASAPINAPAGASGAAASTPISDHRDTTTNYELDKTVRHFQQSPGDIKRLSVAVIVNYQQKVDAKGHATMQPLDAQKLAQVEQLVKDAMGYDIKRGDSVNVVNAAFQTDVDPNANLPWWRQPDMIALAKQIATWLGIGAVALFLYFVMVKPALRRAFPPPEPVAAAAGPALGGDAEPLLLDGLPQVEKIEGTGGVVEGDSDLLALENEKQKFERNLEFARNIARQDPKIVATVVKSWVNDER
ncbi:flagellar basal-body MS-ring/collar protein FliF [Paraburkholderia tropica]|jgi:flagellar M-ring protein FliF|uniref:Flagellar M-ring protein n=1 Tax=Paraburkholderia tropica TaxID=92647 RepID=A0AAQ1GE50_9BURK|nr:flagellar basal-body MS-ring/collar protein FliF [Paraburkholderia tropica]MBB2998464.1 flagellar M-ring protein FliF [Paraburkholderia tropica]MBB6317506.1 flagellar M-ring protein FliF [Paraburkholderia tropica]MDE1142530.1 flagellar basal-body MS-ring/collar protein FliF [Paraburkholderia tropica]PXX15383.1 flagellar M-ring protein FliF [Paraburkholderia tropica]PZW81064.1 flagellar M-ring protein FliF [Paraburkholderia tropica]